MDSLVFVYCKCVANENNAHFLFVFISNYICILFAGFFAYACKMLAKINEKVIVMHLRKHSTYTHTYTHAQTERDGV